MQDLPGVGQTVLRIGTNVEITNLGNESDGTRGVVVGFEGGNNILQMEDGSYIWISKAFVVFREAISTTHHTV